MCIRATVAANSVKTFLIHRAAARGAPLICLNIQLSIICKVSESAIRRRFIALGRLRPAATNTTDPTILFQCILQRIQSEKMLCWDDDSRICNPEVIRLPQFSLHFYFLIDLIIVAEKISDNFIENLFWYFYGN